MAMLNNQMVYQLYSALTHCQSVLYYLILYRFSYWFPHIVLKSKYLTVGVEPLQPHFLGSGDAANAFLGDQEEVHVAGLRNGITGHCARGHLAWIPGGGSFLRRNHLVFWQTDSNDKCVHLPFGWINAIKMLGNWVRSKGSSTHLRLGGVFAFALSFVIFSLREQEESLGLMHDTMFASSWNLRIQFF